MLSTLGSDGYVNYFDCGYGFNVYLYMSKLTKLNTKGVSENGSH